MQRKHGSGKQKERHKQEKRRLADAKACLEEQSKADAEMGGGIVNVQGVQIKTKVNKHPTYLLRDLLGIKSKAEKNRLRRKRSRRSWRKNVRSVRKRPERLLICGRSRGKLRMRRAGWVRNWTVSGVIQKITRRAC